METGPDVRGAESCSMATQKLTKRAIDALPVRDTVYVAYDNSLPGFGCRVTPNGARSWIVEFRPHGGGRRVAKKRITLGPVSVLTPDQARQTAAEVLAKIRLGHDVLQDRAGRRSASTTGGSTANAQAANQRALRDVLPRPRFARAGRRARP
jgi:hypothetical protein